MNTNELIKSLYNEEMSASEALYLFMGWLTSRDEKITLSSANDAAIAAELVNEFIKKHGLKEPRENFTQLFTPKT